jgi:hypothetical protein
MNRPNCRHFGVRQPFRLRGAPKRRSGATAAGAFEWMQPCESGGGRRTATLNASSLRFRASMPLVDAGALRPYFRHDFYE